MAAQTDTAPSKPDQELKRHMEDLAEKAVSPPPLKRQAIQKAGTGDESIDKKPLFPSPFRLTRIHDLPESSNEETVSLHDLLGDPLICECWAFNFLFDVDFVMSHFDPDVRSFIQVKIVHGSWRKEDVNKAGIDEAMSRYPNVQAITAYMPEAFGTHHSKMLVLFRRDETAQVVIHTANMIPRDWKNMTQAIWVSPPLPLLSQRTLGEPVSRIGSGERFKNDLLRYLKHYGENRTGSLTDQLNRYDFCRVRAALISSVPTQVSAIPGESSHTPFGWLGLRRILKSIPCGLSEGPPVVTSQVSSIAYVGEEWLTHFFKVLGTSESSTPLPTAPRRPKHHVMFPTNSEIRNCLDGYSAGASIHMRIHSKQAQRQLTFLRPYLARWASADDEYEDKATCEAGRSRAAPHIKTYVRFSDSKMATIDWAMLTSANLSTQAWGTLFKNSKVRISSYELGIVVWPSILTNDESSAMVPAFGHDVPDSKQLTQLAERPLVGFRMPYNLPLHSYAETDNPWCATTDYHEPDWKGVVWNGTGSG